MDLRTLKLTHVPAMWRINEEGLPGVGQITEAAMANLVGLSTLPLGVFEGNELLGFVLCLPPATRYASLNYAWFNQRYKAFVYVDRIAVAEGHRDKSVGSILYNAVISEAQNQGCPVAAEINLEPPNPGSIRFHERHGFEQVGTFSQGDKTVAMVMRYAPVN